jgi:hypothetical protein
MRRRKLCGCCVALTLVLTLSVSVAALGAASSGAATASGGALRCLVAPAPLMQILRASLSFSDGGRLAAPRAVKSPSLQGVYFLSAQIRAAQLGQRRPIATWVVDRLDAKATASPLNAAAKAYSDLATPDSGTVRLTMRSPGALASQKCVLKLIR